MGESSPSEKILPERLYRKNVSKDQKGCTLAAGIFFSICAVVFGVLPSLADMEDSTWMFYVFSGLGVVLSLLLLWSWFVQMMTAGIPPAVVETSEYPFVSGKRVKICVRQPGPVKFKTLRANLICLRREYKKIHSSETTRYAWVEKQIYDQSLIDIYDVRPSAGDEWIEQDDFYVPDDQPLSMGEKDVQIVWRIEVWGRVGFGMGVMHTFNAKVVAENEAPG